MSNRFDPKKLKKLNTPERLKDIPPEYIWQNLNLDKAETIVDIGAGTGFFSLPFLELSGADKVYACDISEEMIHWMDENIVPGHPEIIPVKMSPESVPLETSSADLLYMINLHHELENPVKTLTEARRLLKRGGKVFIVDWKKEEMKKGPSFNIRCRTKDVVKQLQGAGFRNISVDESLEKFFLVTATASD